MRSQSRDHPHRRTGASRVPVESGESLLLLQARALHAPDGHRAERGIAAIADGSNADDRARLSSRAPGGARVRRDQSARCRRAHEEPRFASCRDEAGLPTWDEPASACLSSRIPYFSEVTEAKLQIIERAENVLHDLGFRVCRVRHHESVGARRGRDRRVGARVRARGGRDHRSRAAGPRLRGRHRRPTWISSRQLERRTSSASCLISAPVNLRSRRSPASFSPRTSHSSRRPSKTSIRSTSRSACRDFDVARHQPHPPGYPVYIALAEDCRRRSVAATPRAVTAGAGHVERARRRGAGRPAVPALFRALDPGETAAAWWGMAIAVACPLFWFTALRPLSDMTGLAFATGAQALLLFAVTGRAESARWTRCWSPAPSSPAVAAGDPGADRAADGAARDCRARSSAPRSHAARR